MKYDYNYAKSKRHVCVLMELVTNKKNASGGSASVARLAEVRWCTFTHVQT